jgi:hypothetical protein
MKRPSRIFVRASFAGKSTDSKSSAGKSADGKSTDNRVVNVRVGGNSVEIMQGEVYL